MLAADRPLDFDATADHRSAQVIQVESLGKGGIAYLLFTGLLSVVVSLMAWSVSTRASDRAAIAERETRIIRDELDRLQVEIGVSTNH